MTIEETIRERHAFEDRVKTLLELFSMMTDREIEIALARLVDLLKATSNESERANISVKGELLKAYYDLRRQGAKTQRSLKRKLLWSPSDPRGCLPSRKYVNFRGYEETLAEYFVRCTAEAVLFWTPQMPPGAGSSSREPVEIVKLLAP